MNTYNVYFGDKIIGRVNLEDDGLYTRFYFCSEYVTESCFRLIAEYDTLSIDLGICCKNGDGLYVNTSVPKKKLGAGFPRFYINDTTVNDIIDFDDNKPFARLEELSKLKYIDRNGNKYLMVN